RLRQQKAARAKQALPAARTREERAGVERRALLPAPPAPPTALQVEQIAPAAPAPGSLREPRTPTAARTREASAHTRTVRSCRAPSGGRLQPGAPSDPGSPSVAPRAASAAPSRDWRPQT